MANKPGLSMPAARQGQVAVLLVGGCGGIATIPGGDGEQYRRGARDGAAALLLAALPCFLAWRALAHWVPA